MLLNRKTKKVMRKFLTSLTILCNIILLTSCINDNLDLNSQFSDKDFCLVNINPLGEITTSITPMSKSNIIMTNDIYCVQVYKIENQEIPYAAGYFDNLESMKLYLKKNLRYRIIVSMIKDAKNILNPNTRFNATQNSLSQSNVYDSFVLKFDRYRPNDSYKYFEWHEKDSSNCVYEGYYSNPPSTLQKKYNVPYKLNYFPLNNYYYNVYGGVSSRQNANFYLGKASTSLDTMSVKNVHLPYIEKAVLNEVISPSCKDWFYGEISEYIPNGNYDNLNLNFRRVGFKLKYELSGVTDGEVTVKIYQGKRVFFENTTTTSTYSSEEQFIAFHTAKSAWEYADNYTEWVTIHVIWKRGIGITQDLQTKKVLVKRNCLNNIKINLKSDNKDSGVEIKTEDDTSLGDSSTTDITIGS